MRKGSRLECKSCKCELGAEAKVLPFTVNDGAGTDGGKPESFCPQCFVHTRASLDPIRFTPGTYDAIHCAACGMKSVAIGRRLCMQCRSPRIISLPPKVS